MTRKILSLGTAVAMLFAGLSIALAQGASKYTPGHQMQHKGAYNYAPGHKKTGKSGY